MVVVEFFAGVLGPAPIVAVVLYSSCVSVVEDTGASCISAGVLGIVVDPN